MIMKQLVAQPSTCTQRASFTETSRNKTSGFKWTLMSKEFASSILAVVPSPWTCLTVTSVVWCLVSVPLTFISLWNNGFHILTDLFFLFLHPFVRLYPCNRNPCIVPSRIFIKKSYWARATTVWQLGTLFYRLLTGRLFSIRGFLNNSLKINGEWSTGRTHTYPRTRTHAHTHLYSYFCGAFTLTSIHFYILCLTLTLTNLCLTLTLT